MATSAPNNSVGVGVQPHMGIRSVDGDYFKIVLLPGGAAAAVEWLHNYNDIRNSMLSIMSSNPTELFSGLHKPLWRIWLDTSCHAMVHRWGVASIPAQMRYWMTVVQSELGDDLLDFGQDYGGNGLFDPDRMWKATFYPSGQRHQTADLSGFVSADRAAHGAVGCMDDDGDYCKLIVLPGGNEAADHWLAEYKEVRQQVLHILSLRLTQRFCGLQTACWQVLLNNQCRRMVHKWGVAGIPAQMRYWMAVVRKELGYTELDFGEDYGGNGLFDANRSWRTRFYPSQHLQTDDAVELDPGRTRGFVLFTFEGSYQKKIEFGTYDELDADEAGVHVMQQCAVWYRDATNIITQFQLVRRMDIGRNDTAEQVAAWGGWLLSLVDPFVQLWGKHNVPATVRYRVHAVERKFATATVPRSSVLHARPITEFGLDTHSSGSHTLEDELADF